VLLGHLRLYVSQRVAAQQLPGVFHEPRETARLLVAVGRTELSTYGPLLRALVRLRPNLTPSGAEVDVDGFDGERVLCRVPFTLNVFHIVLTNILFTSKSNSGSERPRVVG
jgi:hypothetical protein